MGLHFRGFGYRICCHLGLAEPRLWTKSFHIIDLYAYLVNHEDPMDVIAWRTKYYRYCIAAVLESLGAPAGAIHFGNGSSYELDKEFSIDNYKLCRRLLSSDGG